MASNEDIPVSSALNVNDPKLGLMLSYNHQQKEIVNKIKERLRRQGYDVWIDSEKMVGPLTPAMAEAVRDAGIVITCLSKKYEESDNCKFECDRILEYNKPFVPLIMEDFEMDEGSWLKKFKEENLYAKFTDEAKFEESFSELTRLLNLTKDKILKAHIRSQQVPPQGGSGGASSSQQQPEGGIPPKDLGRLQKVVSHWWTTYASIDMLKVLIRQFKEDADLNEIKNTNDVMGLFHLLKGSGVVSISDHALIFEAVKICRLNGVQSDINKIKPTFATFKLDDVEIRMFSRYRQKLIRFGKNLDKSSITDIGYLYDMDEKVHNCDPWLLICALEDKKIIRENSAEDLIETLRSNGMDDYADILEGNQ